MLRCPQRTGHPRGPFTGEPGRASTSQFCGRVIASPVTCCVAKVGDFPNVRSVSRHPICSR